MKSPPHWVFPESESVFFVFQNQIAAWGTSMVMRAVGQC